jgi:hypothetical protein
MSLASIAYGSGEASTRKVAKHVQDLTADEDYELQAMIARASDRAGGVCATPSLSLSRTHTHTHTHTYTQNQRLQIDFFLIYFLFFFVFVCYRVLGYSFSLFFV